MEIGNVRKYPLMAIALIVGGFVVWWIGRSGLLWILSAIGTLLMTGFMCGTIVFALALCVFAVAAVVSALVANRLPSKGVQDTIWGVSLIVGALVILLQTGASLWMEHKLESVGQEFDQGWRVAEVLDKRDAILSDYGFTMLGHWKLNSTEYLRGWLTGEWRKTDSSSVYLYTGKSHALSRRNL